MRNQYKLLSEKYKTINESDKENAMAGLEELELRKQLMEDYLNKLHYVNNALDELADLYNSKDARELFKEIDKAPPEEIEDTLEFEFVEAYSYLKGNLIEKIRLIFNNDGKYIKIQ